MTAVLDSTYELDLTDEDRLGRAISYPRGGLLLDDMIVLAQEIPGAEDRQLRQPLHGTGRR